MTPIWILLLLQLRLTREEAVYVQKGQDRELPCGLDKPLSDAEQLTWSYNANGPGSSSVPIFRGAAGQALKRERDVRQRLSVFPNHSLYLRGAEDGDMGTYWCAAHTVSGKTYQLNVVTGTQKVLTTGHANMSCHQFSCAISDRQALPVVTWWVDEQRVPPDTDGHGRQHVISGSQAALLQACWKGSDQGARKKKHRVRCELKGTWVNFNLTGMDRARTPGFSGSGVGEWGLVVRAGA
ncbi:advillin [Platysternon megacephalum]|uniref:Advillin n=1 Tax=Platysternon megacephalum TaxID=55544 RepID=A0A4D9DMT8_9SAUR|nr:advillin [Platysternon megacephalum]